MSGVVRPSMATRALAPNTRYCDARGPALQLTYCFTSGVASAASGRVDRTSATAYCTSALVGPESVELLALGLRAKRNRIGDRGVRGCSGRPGVHWGRRLGYPMPDLPEQLQEILGSAYRIERELGGGGMSRVFVAEDVELERRVVVKVLSPDLAAGINVDRFRREIQLAARLQHPHIVPLHAAGARGALLYYTMPFIADETLRARLVRSGELPVREAIRILAEIADALSYAHSQGVVHRDIKPENVLLSGHHALVTDFGVAKALARATGDTAGPDDGGLTSVGIALGTPAYMAPEQAAADPMIDHRADIYSLGVVGYELLSGRTPFHGVSSQQMLLAHMTAEPEPVTRHRPNIPPGLAALIMQCLEKNPADRCQTAEEIRAQLDAIATSGSGTELARATREPAWRLTPPRIAVIVGILVAASVLSTIGFGRSDAEFVVGSTRQITSSPGLEIHPAISPDGKMLAYVAGQPGDLQVFVRPVAGGRAIMVTEPGEPRLRPRWSADGTRITYLSPSGMYSVSALGGERVLLLRQTPERWRGDGTVSPSGDRLAFVVHEEESIYIADVDGTNAKKIPTSPARDVVHSLAWSPDGRFIAYVTGNPTFVHGDAIGNLAASTIWVVPTSGGASLPISQDTHLNTSPAWTPDGSHVLFVSTRGGGRDIYSQRVSSRGEARGAPRRLTTGLNAHTISVNSDGSILSYATFVATSNIWTLPIPRLGETTAESMRAVTTGNQTVEHVSISPDGKWLAFDSNLGGNADIYKAPVSGGEPQQLTRDPADDFSPAWSPDGAEIAFHSFRKGNRDLYVMRADGTDVQEVVATPAQEQVARWSADGTTLTYHGGDGIYVVRRRGGPGSGWESPTRVIPRGGSAHPSWSPAVDSFAFATAEGLMVMSPDGGRARIVARMPGATEVVLGVDWSLDGRTLYYSAYDRSRSAAIWSVPVNGGVARRLVRFTDPTRPLFRPRFANDGKNFYFVIGSRESDIWVMDLAKK